MPEVLNGHLYRRIEDAIIGAALFAAVVKFAEMVVV
jgi:hypothetical protein